MGDLFTNIMSASAASSASEAATQARGARAAAEERLEGNVHNPFITLELRGFHYPEKTFFSNGKVRLGEVEKRVSIKRTDIAFLSEKIDDYGQVYTIVHLEDRCNLNETEVFVAGSMSNVQTYINNQ